jgi:hypothetical protein
MMQIILSCIFFTLFFSENTHTAAPTGKPAMVSLVNWKPVQGGSGATPLPTVDRIIPHLQSFNQTHGASIFTLQGISEKVQNELHRHLGSKYSQVAYNPLSGTAIFAKKFEFPSHRSVATNMPATIAILNKNNVEFVVVSFDCSSPSLYLEQITNLAQVLADNNINISQTPMILAGCLAQPSNTKAPELKNLFYECLKKNLPGVSITSDVPYTDEGNNIFYTAPFSIAAMKYNPTIAAPGQNNSKHYSEYVVFNLPGAPMPQPAQNIVLPAPLIQPSVPTPSAAQTPRPALPAEEIITLAKNGLTRRWLAAIPDNYFPTDAQDYIRTVQENLPTYPQLDKNTLDILLKNQEVVDTINIQIQKIKQQNPEKFELLQFVQNNIRKWQEIINTTAHYAKDAQDFLNKLNMASPLMKQLAHRLALPQAKDAIAAILALPQATQIIQDSILLDDLELQAKHLLSTKIYFSAQAIQQELEKLYPKITQKDADFHNKLDHVIRTKMEQAPFPSNITEEQILQLVLQNIKKWQEITQKLHYYPRAASQFLMQLAPSYPHLLNLVKMQTILNSKQAEDIIHNAIKEINKGLSEEQKGVLRGVYFTLNNAIQNNQLINPSEDKLFEFLQTQYPTALSSEMVQDPIYSSELKSLINDLFNKNAWLI